MEFKYELEQPQRLDQFLSEMIETLSREKIKSHIKDSKVKVNGKIVLKPKHALSMGDTVNIEVTEVELNETLVPWTEGAMPEVIYECEDYLIINKPSGLVVHPGVGNTKYTLVNILIAQGYELCHKDSMRPGIVHRLDKNTSGIMIVAKNNQFADYISDRFANSDINKKYHLISDGKYKNSKGIINVPIGRDQNNRKLMKATLDNSKDAKSVFHVIESFKNNEYVEFQIHTGRTHQIRVHSKFYGAPVLNDPEYGKSVFDEEYGQYLHAYEISFKDRQGKEVKYNAPLPDKFNDKLSELRSKVKK